MHRHLRRPRGWIALTLALVIASLLCQLGLEALLGRGLAADAASKTVPALLALAVMSWLGLRGWWSARVHRPVSTTVWVGVFVVVVALTTLVPLAAQVSRGAASWPSAGSLGLHTLVVAATAVFEESTFRALLLGGLVWTLARTGQQAGEDGAIRPSRRALALGVVASTALFSLSHLVGLATRPAGEVWGQVAYTAAIGTFFAALVVRSESLWPAVVAHAAFNWLGGLSALVPATTGAAPSGTVSPLAVVAVQLPWFVAGVVMLVRDLRRDGATLPPPPAWLAGTAHSHSGAAADPDVTAEPVGALLGTPTGS